MTIFIEKTQKSGKNTYQVAYTILYRLLVFPMGKAKCLEIDSFPVT